MILSYKGAFKTLLATAFLACAIGQSASAAEVNGIKFDETVKVAGKDLKLNGAGMRTKFILKVYAAGLYLTEKKTNTADILKTEGPRRVAITFARDVSTDSFGESFMTGINKNTNEAERARLATQFAKIGEVFGMLDGMKKGDVMNIDWIPGSGTLLTMNGKKVGDVPSEIAAYNAMLRIWLGENPADASLKRAMLNAPNT
ncbi:chalcone isomerase family protein [Massilia glaciei]|uniref:Lipoprotein transmembrane n=1 Tax=Massilia glaciei TaxID=1524097 RepID=A0A2U2I766_9BURK|nr:chalcone isomerase family protein [Massilia glaciei]PWF55582.1 lipoprotein transmembrane [Massilia glaciei]